MAPDRKSDEALLHALVDGELSPSERAGAAARLASDRDFARAYATLARLKAAAAEIAKEEESEDALLPLRPARIRWMPYTAAASLALLIGLAGFAVLPSTQGEQRVQDPVAVVPASFSEEAIIPDLSRGGLQLSRTVVAASNGLPSLVATYLGPRGCKLELWVRNRAVAVVARTGTARHVWHVGQLTYELIAFGMPAARFAKVSESAERQTRATTLPEEAEPVVQARIPRPPCVA